MLDSISNFVSAVQNSLRAGTVRNCTFNVPFRTDVFKFIFNSKGNVVTGKRGKSYNVDDFDEEHFPSNWFVSYDRLGNGRKVVFPIHIHSYIKFAPKSYLKSNTPSRTTTPIPAPRDFTEVLYVTLLKSHC